MKGIRLKNFIVGVVVGGMLMSASSVMAQTSSVSAFISSIKYVVNGKPVTIKEKALVKDGTTYVPLRSVAGMLSYDVSYNNTTNTATFNSIDITASSTNTGVASSAKGGNSVENLDGKFLVDGKINLDKVKDAIGNKTIGVNDKDTATGETLFMRAAKDNAYFVLHYLFDQGADVNLQDNEGKTALHYAVINKSASAMGELLDAFKVKTRIKDNSGKMPIDYTVKNSSEYRYLDSYSE